MVKHLSSSLCASSEREHVLEQYRMSRLCRFSLGLQVHIHPLTVFLPQISESCVFYSVHPSYDSVTC